METTPGSVTQCFAPSMPSPTSIEWRQMDRSWWDLTRVVNNHHPSEMNQENTVPNSSQSSSISKLLSCLLSFTCQTLSVSEVQATMARSTTKHKVHMKLPQHPSKAIGAQNSLILSSCPKTSFAGSAEVWRGFSLQEVTALAMPFKSKDKCKVAFSMPLQTALCHLC